MKQVFGWFLLASIATSFAANHDTWRSTVLTRLPQWSPLPPCTIQPVGAGGNYEGFDLMAESKVVARVRLSSSGLIRAGQLENLPGGRLRFSRLKPVANCGLELADSDFVSVAPGQSPPYPEVAFQLSIKRFDASKWTAAAGGPCPFHFLTLSVAGAEAIHHRGWLVATPALDPYPMQIGRQGVVASKWSRDWTWAPPFGACPIPVAGLWAPSAKRYAAWDFTDARINDHTETPLASAYCWKQGRDSNFIALVYPFAQKYVVLRHPTGGETIASHCQLVYDLDLPAWEDPNQRYHERLWRTYYELLPAAPSQNYA